MSYLPGDNDLILEELGIKSTEELFSSIPEGVLKNPGAIGKPLSHRQIKEEIERIKNNNFDGISFSGYGLYAHYIPDVVDHLASLRNFLTSYTPYQPEAAQGTLQALFEYQSLMSSLTAMDVVNASLYDGATAMIEAVRMGLRSKAAKSGEKNIILLSEGIHPSVMNVLNTYFSESILIDLNVEFIKIPLNKQTGETDWNRYSQFQPPSQIVFQNPNYLGIIEQGSKNIKKRFPEVEVLYGTLEALSLAVLPSPSEYDADIIWGDAQSFGIGVSMGGPTLGFIGCKSAYMRQLPGRIIGKTSGMDSFNETNNCFVITLATREQHIRREKATSNICSNQSLMALRAAIYMASMGWHGMQSVMVESIEHNIFFQKRLNEKGIQLLFPQGTHLNETSWICNDPEKLFQKAKEKNIFPGVLTQYQNQQIIITAFTELHKRNDIEQLLSIIDQ